MVQRTILAFVVLLVVMASGCCSQRPQLKLGLESDFGTVESGRPKLIGKAEILFSEKGG